MPALEGALEKVAATATDRVAVRQAYIDRAVPAFLGIPAPPVTRWMQLCVMLPLTLSCWTWSADLSRPDGGTFGWVEACCG